MTVATAAAVADGLAEGPTTWLSTRRTIVSATSAVSGPGSSGVVRSRPRDTTSAAPCSSRSARVVRNGRRSSAAPVGGGHDREQERVAPRAHQHRAGGPADRGHRVVRVGVEGGLDDREEAGQLVQDHRLGQERPRSHLVVDRLAADSRRLRDPRHRQGRPAVFAGQCDRGLDDAPAGPAGRRFDSTASCRRLVPRLEVDLLPHAAVRAAPVVRHGGPGRPQPAGPRAERRPRRRTRTRSPDRQQRRPRRAGPRHRGQSARTRHPVASSRAAARDVAPGSRRAAAAGCSPGSRHRSSAPRHEGP